MLYKDFLLCKYGDKALINIGCSISWIGQGREESQLVRVGSMTWKKAKIGTEQIGCIKDQLVEIMGCSGLIVDTTYIGNIPRHKHNKPD